MTGYENNGEVVAVEVTNFILDAPARSMVKCCIGHGGYGSCEKCCVVGEYSLGRIHFANVPDNCRLRTDQSFHDQSDRLHHVGRSPLEFINVGMVSQFRLDSMHLVYKDAIFNWLGPWNPGAGTVQEISTVLLSFVQDCPRDFNRKPRKIEDFTKYKATELRRLLLYDGIVAFKDKLQPEIYDLYLLLHCSIYISSSSHCLPLFVDQAEVLIRAFVEYSAAIFGQHFVVYNVHSLTHLPAECREHGTLDSFGAFPYENELKNIKQTLRSGYKPLEQIVKRDSERTVKKSIALKSRVNEVQLFQPLRDGPRRQCGNQFQRVSVNGVSFKSGPKDSCFMTNDGGVAVIENIILRGDNDIVFCARRFNVAESYYNYPLHSSCLGIFKVSELNEDTELFPLEVIHSKCWLIRDGDIFFVLIRFDEKGEDEDNCVLEIGCRKWLDTDMDGNIICKWPCNQELDPSKFKSLVLKQVEPDETWVDYKCEVISAYNKYLDAHIGLKKRLEDSSYETEKKRLSSDDEDEPPLKQKTSKKLRSAPKLNFSSQVSQFESSQKSPSKIIVKHNVSSKEDQNKNTLKVSRGNRGSQADNFADFKKIVEEKKKKDEAKRLKSKERIVCTSPSWKARPVSELSKRNERTDDLNGTFCVDNDLDDNFDNNLESSFDQGSSTPLKGTATASPSGGSDIQSTFGVSKEATRVVCNLFGVKAFSSDSHKNAASNAEASKDILESKPQYSSNFEKNVLLILNEINQKTEVISANQTKLNLHLIPNEKGVPTIPLKSNDAVLAMEKCLEKDPDNICNLSTLLSTNVSKDPLREEASARRVMSALLGNSVGKLYSLRGQKGKLAFQDLALWTAVKVTHSIAVTVFRLRLCSPL
ncbi:DNA-directed RNA polymerase subunit gamma [Frankliniella fusca]|uniref:DNA-directed RNA polymerase subunit gamma n=1 Tax=Frankliniella fusca TaxID=407009 RepID=A0AAE1HVN1_9NEOP|nr:DNA-directed RNA polymerase subunit gamma [Frankliniella fusca]